MLIDPRAWYIGKALYFFLFAALGIFVPFANVYYKEIGLSGLQIGWLNTLGPFIGILSGPLWGLLTDRLGKMRLTLGIVAGGAMLAVFNISRSTTFGGILWWSAVLNLFASAIMPLVDSYNITLLGEQRQRYSEQRLWGTYGFLVSSGAIGYLLSFTGLRAIFWGYILCLGFFLLALVALPPAPARMGRAVFEGFTRMIRQPVWIILAGSVILVMIANNSWINFLGIAMKQMGASDNLVGQAWSLGALAEVPVMLLGSRLLARFGSRRLMTMGFFFYGLRLLLYAVMPHPAWALAIGVLHGVSFGFYWVGGVNYVSEIAPAELRATGQSMLAVFFNLASVTAAPLMGFVYDRFGAGQMFLLAAFTAWAGVALFVSGTWRQKFSLSKQ